jgi:hypothetical protein
MTGDMIDTNEGIDMMTIIEINVIDMIEENGIIDRIDTA